MNSAPLPEKEAIFRFTKVFIAQYLSSIHNFEAFHDEALNLLTLFLIKILRAVAVKVKNILNLQGRTIPNALHALVVAHQTEMVDFQKLLQFIVRNKEVVLDAKSLDIVEQLGKNLFQNDIESINNYPKEIDHPNIRYIPPVYTFDLYKKALPYRRTIMNEVDPVDEVLPLPPEVTYQQTRQKVDKDKKNVEHLSSYTRRENRLAMVGRMIDEEHRKEVKVDQNGQTEDNFGFKPQKKQKFDIISHL